MAATINTNTYSLSAQRNLAKNSLGLASAIERLSSGLRVNSARDDASGLATGMAYEATARATAVQIRADSDAISTAETQDGALAVVNDILQRMAELQAGTAADSTTELELLKTQANTLAATGGIVSLGATSASGASALITTVATQRATHGATMNNAEFKIQAGQVKYANTMAARGRIMDADFAVETSNLSRFQVLQQAGTAMVAQANAIPQNVLALLR